MAARAERGSVYSFPKVCGAADFREQQHSTFINIILHYLNLRHAAEREMCVVYLAFVNHCYSSNKIQKYIYLSFIKKKSIKIDNRVCFKISKILF